MSKYPSLLNSTTRFSWFEKTSRGFEFTTVNRKKDARSEFYLNKRVKFPEIKVYQTDTEGSGSEWRLSFAFLWLTVNMHLWTSTSEFRDWEDSNAWGYDILDLNLVVQIGRKRWSTLLPFVTSVHVRHELLNHDRSVHWIRPDRKGEWSSIMDQEREEKKATQEVHPYRYVLNNGEVQERTVTVNFTRTYWRTKWTPFISYQDHMDYWFSDEVGEGSGSYKGGVLGSAIKALPGETLEQCVRRLESTVKFSR